MAATVVNSPTHKPSLTESSAKHPLVSLSRDLLLRS
jgi:hypothetical protein